MDKGGTISHDLNPPDKSEPERARTHLIRYGPEYVSNKKLLTILLSPGCSRENVTKTVDTLLKTFHGDLKALFSASVHELVQIENIGYVKACQIKAAFELGKRIISHCKEEHLFIASTENVITLMAPHMMCLKQEEFRVLLLTSKNRLIRYETVSKGSLNAALVEPREVFRPAITAGAASIILVHNHPSGDPEPSERDIALTRGLCMCGKVVGIEVLDHIIIGHSDCVSMKYRELM